MAYLSFNMAQGPAPRKTMTTAQHMRLLLLLLLLLLLQQQLLLRVHTSGRSWVQCRNCSPTTRLGRVGQRCRSWLYCSRNSARTASAWVAVQQVQEATVQQLQQQQQQQQQRRRLGTARAATALA